MLFDFSPELAFGLWDRRHDFLEAAKYAATFQVGRWSLRYWIRGEVARQISRPPMNIAQVPAFYAPLVGNYTKGRKGKADLIILHGMGGTLTGTSSWFKNPVARASTHYSVGSPNRNLLVDEIHQHVSVHDTAWGVRYDAQLKDSNVRSVQIEVQNRDPRGTAWVKESWYGLTAELVFTLAKDYFNKRPDRSWVLLHREADPRKRECPANIDAERIVREAQALWDKTAPAVPPVDTTFWEGQSIPAAPVPRRLDVLQLFPTSHAVKVVVPKGERLNVRQGFPGSKDENGNDVPIHSSLANGTPIRVAGFIHKEIVDHSLATENDKWYLTAVSWEAHQQDDTVPLRYIACRYTDVPHLHPTWL